MEKLAAAPANGKARERREAARLDGKRRGRAGRGFPRSSEPAFELALPATPALDRVAGLPARARRYSGSSAYNPSMSMTAPVSSSMVPAVSIRREVATSRYSRSDGTSRRRQNLDDQSGIGDCGAGKPCAGNRHARFERGSCPFTGRQYLVKGQDLPMARTQDPLAEVPRGLRVVRRMEPAGPRGYRTRTGPGELLVERRFFELGHAAAAAAVVVSAAILGYTWHARVRSAGDFEYGTSILFYVAAALIALVAGILGVRIFGKQTIAVRGDTLIVRGGGRAHAIPAQEIARIQRDSRASARVGHRVLAITTGGKSVVLVGNLPRPEQARYLERALEEALGIAAEGAAEPARDPPNGALPRRSLPLLVLASLGLPVTVAVLAVTVRGCGQPVGVLRVPPAGEPATITLELDVPRELRVVVDWKLRGRYVERNREHRRRADLPKHVRVEIDVEGKSERRRLACNPFDLFTWTNVNTGGSWSNYGPMENCRLQLTAGKHAIRAALEGELGEDFQLASLNLVLMR